MSQERRQAPTGVKGPKNIQQHLQEGEVVLFSAPGFWDNGEVNYSTACELVLTNQRIIGYYTKSFPREHLFLDSLPLANLTQVSLRQKNYEPLFRELLVSDGTRKIYMRTSRRHIERLYALLSETTGKSEDATQDTATEDSSTPHESPSYARQKVRTSFESSSLGITVLFVGGLLLEIIGVVLWRTQGAAIGTPLCIAGLVAVTTALLVRRQRTLS
ncbi:hypothetical protein [Ktedonobacter racemifer]|uniref:Uncharacterized protein n=1 Tax=Ktedonobacter racemifer DSM 44963 TaxID=485913 RepID=D6TJR1_KTERA|nr:hypothetical protein [Ktedonobacter racemifer]EFH89668.1 hypothetical protein Krac_11233 [Ktedonobacter racemifer DSM 44963]